MESNIRESDFSSRKTFNNKKTINQKQYMVKIKSKIHQSVYHSVYVDLHCYERMPNDHTVDLHCYERMLDEKTLNKCAKSK